MNAMGIEGNYINTEFTEKADEIKVIRTVTTMDPRGTDKQTNKQNLDRFKSFFLQYSN